VIRSGLRRLAVIFLVLVALTSAVSVGIGALAHANLARAVADGFYVMGSAILVGSFVLGISGPLRTEWEDGEHDRPRVGILPRRVRRTTFEERVESRRNSLALFGLGILLLLLGGAFDPTRSAF